jgi:hypothetical protein
MENEERLTALYAAFNAHDADTATAGMAEDVDWPNGWEGGRVHGREAVREYWRRQWAEIDSQAEPAGFHTDPEGRIVVEVDQYARGDDGEPVGRARVRHVYELSDNLVTRMTIEEPAAADSAGR